MIEQKILTHLRQGQRLALVTIIAKSGSAPRLPGSKMLVAKEGVVCGTIGGGRMEYLAAEMAMEVAGGALPVLNEFDMRGSGVAGDMDMICGGVQLILIEAIVPEMIPLFEQAVYCLQHGAMGVWQIDVTDPESPGRSFLDMEKQQSDSGIDYVAIMRRRTACVQEVEGRSLVVDPLPTCGTVVLVGGGHVSCEVAGLASYVDFDVLVCDDREEFVTQKRFPTARSTHVVQNFKDVFTETGVGEEYYILIITRGHDSDQDVLAQALRSSARYIGMIGSRRKREVCYRNLREQGFTDTDFARVHCPVGISIGSETPEEIAVSIIAELIAARAGAV